MLQKMTSLALFSFMIILFQNHVPLYAMNTADTLTKNTLNFLTKGQHFYDQKKYEKAFKYFQKSADLGNPDAQFRLSYCYLKGRGTKAREDLGFDYCKKAADQEHTLAQYNLWILLDQGRGCTRDTKEAVVYFNKVANKGYPGAFNDRGESYFKSSHGLKKDYKKAFYWFQRAAKECYEPALYNVGFCYYNGYGVNKNKALALEYLIKSAELGIEQAQQMLNKISAQNR